MSVIRVVVADDHPAVRLGLVDFLGAQAGLEIVGQAADGVDAVALTEATSPDVVVMDINMPNLDGIAATRRIKELRPSTGVLLLTAIDNEAVVDAGRDAGADAFYLKGIFGLELVDRVREVRGA